MSVTIPVIKLRQGEYRMYVGAMLASDLYSVATVDRIRLEKLEFPKYAGFQRALVGDRVSSIRDYLSTPQATFPNAIIVSLDSEYIEEWPEDNHSPGSSQLVIKREKGAIKIIDGQHRAAALDVATHDFTVIVTLFVDLEMFKCAEIFTTINSTQRPVNRSIAYQLFGYSDRRSPQRTAHDIAELLCNTEGAPFYRRLKMVGSRDEWVSGGLSQATFCKHLMELYTAEPESDEYSLSRGETLVDTPDRPLRKQFMAEDDDAILRVVWRFFFGVAQTWPDQWDDKKGISILGKTTGYHALMIVLRRWLLSPHADEIMRAEDDKSAESIAKRLSQAKEQHSESGKPFIRKHYPAGNQGVVVLRDELLSELGFVQPTAN